MLIDWQAGMITPRKQDKTTSKQGLAIEGNRPNLPDQPMNQETGEPYPNDYQATQDHQPNYFF